MCGKYIVATEVENTQMRAIIARIQRKYEGVVLQQGDMLPSQIAPALSREGALPLRWGFASPAGKGLVINARCETAATRPLFRKALLTCRCLLPAAAFYEWDARKVCHVFSPPDDALLYMAGLYQPQGEDIGRFVILTRPANGTVSPVHPRMPYILPSGELREAWLNADALAGDILAALPPVALKQNALKSA